VDYNSEIENNKIKLLTEYENVSQRDLLLIESILRNARQLQHARLSWLVRCPRRYYVYSAWNISEAASEGSDAYNYIIIRKLLDSILNIALEQNLSYSRSSWTHRDFSSVRLPTQVMTYSQICSTHNKSKQIRHETKRTVNSGTELFFCERNRQQVIVVKEQ
jgi:hypothetical protein